MTVKTITLHQNLTIINGYEWVQKGQCLGPEPDYNLPISDLCSKINVYNSMFQFLPINLFCHSSHIDINSRLNIGVANDMIFYTIQVNQSQRAPCVHVCSLYRLCKLQEQKPNWFHSLKLYLWFYVNVAADKNCIFPALWNLSGRRCQRDLLHMKMSCTATSQ